MDFLAEYGLFFLQTMTVVAAVILVIAVSSKMSGGDEAKGIIKVTDLSKKIAEQKKYVSAIVETALTNDQPSFLERLKKSTEKEIAEEIDSRARWSEARCSSRIQRRYESIASERVARRGICDSFNGSDPSSCGPEINLARRIGSHLWISKLPACAFARCRG